MRIVVRSIQVKGCAAQVTFDIITDDGTRIEDCTFSLRSDWLVSVIRAVRDIERDLRWMISNEVGRYGNRRDD